MLRELSIRNIALIKSMTISFGEGLCVLSGETGAGKSIIVDAVELILGGRADKELIRAGEETAYVEALLDPSAAALSILEEYGVECEDGMLVLSREIGRRSSCRINGRLQSTAALRRVAGACVNLHGQNRLAEVLEEKNHLSLLDGFADDSGLLSRVGALFGNYSSIKKEMDALDADEALLLREADMLGFACAELESASLRAGEEDELRAERRLIGEAEKVSGALNLAHFELSGGAVDSLARASRALADIAALDPAFETLRAALDDAYYTVEDAAYQLSEKKDAYAFDEDRLNDIEERLSVLSGIKRKYGGSVENAIEYHENAKARLSAIENKDETRALLKKRLDEAKGQLSAACAELSAARKCASERFSARIIEELGALGMKNAEFYTELTPKAFGADGADEACFMISVNAGQPPRPLSRVVSGGEASRIMLAIKSIFAEKDGVSTLIFDEIDAGISGRMAAIVARKLAALSRFGQVICVTHLPQLAAMADCNYLVAKTSDGASTRVSFTALTGKDLAAEVARLSGGSQTQKALEHAAELIAEAGEFKKTL